MAPGIAGLILAGGSGERYGSPKAFARLPDGRPFLAVCAEALKAGGAEPVLATLPAGTPALQAPGLECLPLPAPGLAMFDSLRLGLQHLLADTGWRAVIVLPVDHPLVAPATAGRVTITSGDPVARGKARPPRAALAPAGGGDRERRTPGTDAAGGAADRRHRGRSRRGPRHQRQLQHPRGAGRRARPPRAVTSRRELDPGQGARPALSLGWAWMAWGKDRR